MSSAAILFLDICRILTFIGSGIIIIFLIFHLKRVEKIARPFIISLLVLFSFEISGAILNWIFNKMTAFNTVVDPLDPIYFLYGLGGLPSEAGSIIKYNMKSYKKSGKKSKGGSGIPIKRKTKPKKKTKKKKSSGGPLLGGKKKSGGSLF